MDPETPAKLYDPVALAFHLRELADLTELANVKAPVGVKITTSMARWLADEIDPPKENT